MGSKLPILLVGRSSRTLVVVQESGLTISSEGRKLGASLPWNADGKLESLGGFL